MQYSNEEKAMWLEDWKQSGKSAWSYAKDQGLVLGTFLKWIKAESASKQRFVEVPKQIIGSPHDVREILIEKGAVKIHIPLGLCCDELIAVIKVVEGLS